MIIQKLLSILNKGNKRSILVKKNIILSFGLKGLGILINLLYVPLTLQYLNPTRYGIWMTLTSIVAWFGLFDIGFGNGLRNKLTTSLAKNEKIIARKYVSTTYAILSIMVSVIFVIFLIGNNWIDWTKLLNTPPEYKTELSLLAVVVFTSFCVKFVLQIISIVLIADQRPAFGSSFDVLGSALGLLAIWVLIHFHSSSLLTFGISVMIIPVLIFLIASIFFYNKRYVFLKPSIKYVDFSYGKDIAGLGIKFFFIQVAAMVIFQSSNILIAQLFSPADVTPYNIAFKYFSILTMLWGILMSPLWSAFTHALSQGDYNWMKVTMIKLNRFMIVTIFIIIGMILLAKPVISFWTVRQVTVPFAMIGILALYTTVSIWNNIYSFFLNGVSQIRIQIYTSIIASLIHIPMAFCLVKYAHMGPEGIVLSMTISLSLFAIAGPIKSYKILKLWTKN